MLSNITIYKASLIDIGLLKDFSSACVKDYHISDSSWHEYLSNESYITLATCFSDTRLPIGFIVALTVHEEADVVYITVDSQYRYNGIGKLLINTLAKYNIKRLYIEVSKANKNAIAFYTNVGFTFIGIRKQYYSNETDAIIGIKQY